MISGLKSYHTISKKNYSKSHEKNTIIQSQMLSQSKNITLKRNRLTEYARDSKQKSAFHYSIFQNSISPSK